jgi:hypothetical protein
LKTDQHPGRVKHHRHLGLVSMGLMFALVPLAVARASGAAATSSGSSGATVSAAPAATASTSLTLGQWKQNYEHDIGILADDVLVVVDDGKRAQVHVTTAKVKTTLKDCRRWRTDAAEAGAAAPPIPMASAQRAWTSMIGASSQAAAQCVASLQRGSRGSATAFRRQLAEVEKDEAALVGYLNG